LCNFKPEFSNHWSLQILPMLHPLVWRIRWRLERGGSE
jgi:hypothetical protein